MFENSISGVTGETILSPDVSHQRRLAQFHGFFFFRPFVYRVRSYSTQVLLRRVIRNGSIIPYTKMAIYQKCARLPFEPPTEKKRRRRNRKKKKERSNFTSRRWTQDTCLFIITSMCVACVYRIRSVAGTVV